MPIIGGLPEGYIKKVMQQFKSGERFSTIMGRLAKGYQDQDLATMAEYFSKQQWVSASQPVEAALLKRGQMLHEDNCESCHEDNGRSTAENMSRMAGQWAGYLEIELYKYRDEQFKMPQPKKMLRVLKELSPEDLKALVQFYASQK